jgi:hypothetical protein
MTTFEEAFRQTFAEKRVVYTKPRSNRTPVLVLLGTALATVTAFFFRQAVRFRRNIMYLAGFGFIDYALFSWSSVIGYAAIGVTLLILEMLSGGDEK